LIPQSVTDVNGKTVLQSRNCAAITADASQLAYEQTSFKQLAKNLEIPLALTYRLDDPQWAAIVNWTVEALIQAEESGITPANLAEMKKCGDPVIRRLLGIQRGYGQFIGLDDAWAARVIEAVGN
jgi:general L-amino acid transport system substrate-binding protein